MKAHFFLAFLAFTLLGCNQTLDAQTAALKVDSLLTEAEILVQQEKYLEAAERFAEAVAIEQRSEAPRPSAVLLNLTLAGRAYFEASEHAKALQYLERAVEVAEQFDMDREQITLLYDLGVIHQLLRQSKEALGYFERMLALSERLEEEAGIAVALMHIGFVYGTQSQYTTALGYYERALEIAARLDMHIESATLLNNIGEMHREQGRYAEAISHFEKALEIEEHLNRETETAVLLNNIGRVYYNQGHYTKALDTYQRALEIDRRLERETGIAIRLTGIGLVHTSQSKFDEALGYFEQALEIHEQLGAETEIPVVLGNIGYVHRLRGQYITALDYYMRALEIDQRLDREANVGIWLNNIGQVYREQGHYDKALAYFNHALEIDQRLGREAGVGILLNNIGQVYREWGRYDDALDYHERALEIAERLGREPDSANVLNEMGLAYQELDRYDEAFSHFEQALVIDRNLGREDGAAMRLSNIGKVYRAWGRYDDAISHYEQALEITQRLEQAHGVSTLLGLIGDAYGSSGRYAEALNYYQRSVEIEQNLGREAEMAALLNNVGAAYWETGDFEKAVAPLNRALERKERLRQTAEGDIRRDYLASQIATYQYLISTHLKLKNVEEAFRIIEMSHARRLAEQLAQTDTGLAVPALNDVRRRLDDDTAVLIYANTGRGLPLAQLLLTREDVHSLEVSDSVFVADALQTYMEDLIILMLRQRLLQNSEGDDASIKLGNQSTVFEHLIHFYHTLLTNPAALPTRSKIVGRGRADSTGVQLHDLSRRFHDLLILPLDPLLTGKSRLLIVPDGVLGFLPFETLIDSSGRYLAEKYDIRYIQSLSVLDLIQERNYADDRKPLLAFGDAVYDASNYTADSIRSARQLNMVRSYAYEAIERGERLDSTYALLGIGGWQNLPGTRQEVEALDSLVVDAEVVTGADVSEAMVKQMSASGALGQYRVLHFATHGLVVPDVPELSALVLSQGKKQQEDGYLHMGEVAQLKLAADFAALSACETGLGRLYGGEGVVGLAQAFMLAGANALSVSLWRVADRSTSVFMQEVYRLVEEEKLGYAEALTQVKRGFLAGDYGEVYRAPYYWAPFVYYGQ